MEGSIEFIATVFRFCLGTLFVVAGVSKLGNKQTFERAVRGYGLLPPRLAPVVSAGLPPLELVAGFLLLAGLAIPAVALALVMLLSVFTFAVAFNLARGRRIDCGCFGVGVPRAITWASVARNVGLAAMAVVVVLAAPRALALDSLLFSMSSTASHSDGVAALLAASAGLATAALTVETRRIRGAVRRTSEVVR